MKTILVTGAAGFIGANLVLRLLERLEPTKIVGLDNLGDVSICVSESGSAF